MNVVVDIGNTRLKCGLFVSEKGICVSQSGYFPKKRRENKTFYRSLLDPKNWENSWDDHDRDAPITWQIAQTGSFPFREFQNSILELRPQDKFRVLTRRDIPLKVKVDNPEKVGLDRLLAAFAAVRRYGDAPMLIVDAGTAITIDFIHNETFCGGAILPGLEVISHTLPKISPSLPFVEVPCDSELDEIELPSYPGRNTEDAIANGLYWGTIGAIRQFYDFVSLRNQDVLLGLTGGDGQYLLQGLVNVIPESKIFYREILVLEGINQCISERNKDR